MNQDDIPNICKCCLSSTMDRMDYWQNPECLKWACPYCGPSRDPDKKGGELIDGIEGVGGQAVLAEAIRKRKVAA